MKIERVKYILKGKLANASAKSYLSIVHTPWFDSPEEAQDFYKHNIQFNSFYGWQRYKDIAVFKKVYIEDEIVESVKELNYNLV